MKKIIVLIFAVNGKIKFMVKLTNPNNINPNRPFSVTEKLLLILINLTN